MVLRIAGLEIRRAEKDMLLLNEIQPVQAELETVRDGLKRYGEAFDAAWGNMVRAGPDEKSGQSNG
jgi:hypothetical protein